MKRHHNIDPASKGAVNSQVAKPAKTQSNTSPAVPVNPVPAIPSNPFLMAQRSKLTQSKIRRISVGIACYLIRDMRPFSTVESPAFRKMINECEPRYKFPCRGTFSEQLIPEMYESVSSRVKDELRNTEAVAWTTDSWTSRATQSYVIITAHFVDTDLELCSRVLQTRLLPESHTGEHVGNVLREAQVEWGCRVAALTTDNAANMRIAARTAGIPIHIGCFAHTLNLASGRALDVKEVQSILSKIRSVVSFLHRSTTAAALLSKKQEMLQLPQNKLIIDVKTRWNSSYLMVERFLQQQLAILATLSDEKIKKQHEAKSVQATSVLAQDELQRCEEFLRIMEPMYQATLAMSSAQYPTVGLVYPLLKKLKKIYSPSDDDSVMQLIMKRAILQDLEKRYQSQILVEYLEEATALDPRVKDKAPPASWDRVQAKLMELPAITIKSEPVDIADPTVLTQPHLPQLPVLQCDIKQDTSDSDLPPPPKKKSALSFLIDDEDEVQISKIEPPVPKDELLRKETVLYRGDPKLTSDRNPLHYWKDCRFPWLSRLAKTLMCAQASSVPSERVFSTAGDIVTATRSCLDPEHVDKLVFMKKNLDEAKDLGSIWKLVEK